MAHISITGVPRELEQEAISWLHSHVFPIGHTGNVKAPDGEVRYGNSDAHTAMPAPTADAPAPTDAGNPATAASPTDTTSAAVPPAQ